MHVDHTDPLPERADMHIRVYKCPACYYEMRLTVWGVEPCGSAWDRFFAVAMKRGCG
jgi:hypothetical protein